MSPASTTWTALTLGALACFSGCAAQDDGPVFYPTHFMHQPAGMKWGALNMTIVNLGDNTKVRTGGACNRACWAAYADNCLYTQWVEGGDCFIAEPCFAEEGCQSVADVNVPGKDLNRVYCKNKYFIEQWYTWKENKGPLPCSWVSDDGVAQSFVDKNEKVIHRDKSLGLPKHMQEEE